MKAIQKIKKVIGITAGILLSTVLFTEVANAKFVDVDGLKNGGEHIYYLEEKGIVKGYGNGKFGPEEPVTRQQAVTMLARYFDWDISSNEQVFDDVPVSNPSNKYIVAAVKNGVIAGRPDGTFGPYEHLTRAQMAVILERAFEYEKNFDAIFKDISDTFWARDSVSKIVSNGIAVGYTDGTYKPNINISRRHYSMMLARAIEPKFSSAMTVQATPYDGLNIRKGPSVSYDIVGMIDYLKTAKFNPQNVKNGWGEVTYENESGENVTGYVNLRYLRNYIAPSNSVEGKVIVLDPGHGGHDGGAHGNGLVEKTLNLKTAKYVKDELVKKGAIVHLTRTDDTYLTLEERSNFAAKKGAGVFISIHMNSAENSASHGTETFYNDKVWNGGVNPYPKESKKLAESIQKELASLPTSDRGVKQSAFYVLRENSVPSVLVEVAFVSNEKDANLLKDDSFLKQAAKSISQGIINYYENN